MKKRRQPLTQDGCQKVIWLLADEDNRLFKVSSASIVKQGQDWEGGQDGATDEVVLLFASSDLVYKVGLDARRGCIVLL